MTSVSLHPAESDRLDSLRSYQVLDTQPEPSFDRLVALAARLCDTPVAAVTLVDANRQWFKAAVGLGTVTETPRAWSFCSDVVAAGAALAIPDVRDRFRYRKNPMVEGKPGVRAYAGVPLIGRDGLPLGTLCVVDTKPGSSTQKRWKACRSWRTRSWYFLKHAGWIGPPDCWMPPCWPKPGSRRG